MRLILCTVSLWITLTKGLSVPQNPSLVNTQPAMNASQTVSASLNTTAPHLLGEWPPEPVAFEMANDMTFTIHAFGRAPASYAAVAKKVLDSMSDMIYHLLAAGAPSDLIRTLDITSTSGFVKAGFGSVRAPNERLTREEALEVLDLVRSLFATYGPREILMAELEEDWDGGRGLVSLFRLTFPIAIT